MTTREVYRGLFAAACALSAMVGTAAAGLLLLDADRAGRLTRLTAAVVAMAAGGPATIEAVPTGGLPIAVQGQISVMPLGVSLVGAVALGTLLLRHGRSGLLVRGLSAAAAFTAGAGAVAMSARGMLTLPSGSARAAVDGMGACGAGTRLPLTGAFPIDQLQAGFSVSAGSTVAGGAVGALAVAGLCWLTARFLVSTGTLRAARWAIAGPTVVCVPVAWAVGGPRVAGGLLLVLPLVVGGALLHGLGVPWSFSADGVLACVLDGGWPAPGRGAPAVLSVVVLLACGVAVAARTGRDRAGGPLRRAAGLAVRLAPVVAAVLFLLTLLSRVSAELGVRAVVLAVPVLDVRLVANPWGALIVGLGAGAVAGFAGSLLVDAFRRRAGRLHLTGRASGRSDRR